MQGIIPVGMESELRLARSIVVMPRRTLRCHDESHRFDLYRVNFEVNNLKSFARVAFPFSLLRKNGLKQPSFGDELRAVGTER